MHHEHNKYIQQGLAPILQALKTRLDQLPKESLEYVAVLLAIPDLIPSPLAETLLGMILIQHKLAIGPVHEALAASVILKGFHEPHSAALRQQYQALIFACRGNKAALAALEFIMELPRLMDSSR